ncbi:MAG: twin-arginine translocase TatA/TatE family subunit [Dehalococcoidia bacterium]
MALPIGWPEGIVILVVILIVFGVGKLPQVGGALGKGLREFRRGRAGLLEDLEEEEEEEEEEKPKRKKRTPKKIAEGKTK